MNDHELKNIPDKASKILYGLLIVFLCIGIRLWMLTVHQYEEKKLESKKPGKKTEMIPSKRATIRDRFNEPFALNKLNYDLAIVYSDLKTIPSTKWVKDPSGKKIKLTLRKDYIKELSQLLHRKIGIDPNRLEDEIHAKAALFNNIPYLVKSNLSEKEYLELKSLELFWPGLMLRKNCVRTYPNKKSAAHIIGSIGMISKEEYEAKLLEREELKLYLEGIDLGADMPLPEGYNSLADVKKRIRELSELAYTVTDAVGKSGIEQQFEETLRGIQGKKTTLFDNKGHLIKDYPGSRDPKPGQRILLSISRELQEEAEKLLAISENTRETKVKYEEKGTIKADKVPFIKGGACIAIDPNTGEILAMASYPRFDPNDYTSQEDKRSNRLEVQSYLEDATAVKNIWDGLIPLKKERWDMKEEKMVEVLYPLTWPFFLELILNPNGSVKQEIESITTLEKAFKILSHPDSHNPYVVDLLKLNVDPSKFPPDLKKKVGKTTLADYRAEEQAWVVLNEAVKDRAKTLFREIDFKKWREEKEKEFIQQKRLIEKEAKKFPKPYLDYLDEEEKELFSQFWDKHKTDLLLSLIKGENYLPEYGETFKLLAEEILKGANAHLFWRNEFLILHKAFKNFSYEEGVKYLGTFRTLDDRTEPLKAPWRVKKPGTLKQLATSFYPAYGYGFSRSFAYRQAATQGSIFKLVTAYTALKLGKMNPLEIKDQIFKIGSQVYVGYDSQGKPIPQLYKGGRIPRSSHNQMGTVDLLTAIEKSSNPYFALLAMDVIKSPEDLIKSAKDLSFGEKTGIQLPGEIQGRLPKDLEQNPTGLFATSIGQHTLVVTPLQTSVMLSAIANGGLVFKPQIIKCKAGICENVIDEIPNLTNYPLETNLNMAGIDFPLFTALINPDSVHPIALTEAEVKRKVFMPENIRRTLLEGMRRVVTKTLNDSIFQLSKIYHHNPEVIASYIDVKNHLAGKTSTSEALERLNLDEPNEKPLYTHVWFGGIGFEDESFRKPEIVVVVYLRYGGYGKEAAPIAAHLIKKWREIKASKN